jgi:hypothetical protein
MAHVPVSSPEWRTLDPVTVWKIANTSSKNAAKLNILHDRVDKNYIYKEIRADTFIPKHIEEKRHKICIKN